MIHLSEIPFEQIDMWPPGSVESIIFQKMNEGSIVYSYQSIGELLFELKLRKQIMLSARAMSQSNVQFEPFEKSRCNPYYWDLLNTGGFQLRPGVKPSDAIQDIYTNSSQYAFECATAIIIIYYHATLNSLDEHVFNQLFQNIYLYSWHFDPDLGVNSIYTDHLIPGDVVYFNNPDFHLETPWWRGENAVVLEDGTYYGHGLGILTAEQIIQALNQSRNPGSNQSAYLENLVTRPSFKGLANFSMLPRGYMAYKIQHAVIHHNESSIPCGRYLFYLNTLYNQLNGRNPFL
ncbi:protein-glutamine gamma-glutamyltransferase [Halalkalibacter alkalisediminis]|uniref:Protein-glutamine gamma-glutamyltransferase n=1 Tax=Halalkalibacter alkalisediminis TaxID=935616 RepID=A0ABV6NLU4_9BACI|nr:protein-glutamine gamma-glutamyltransferase [Halalkalibacter alkalisediminis]